MGGNGKGRECGVVTGQDGARERKKGVRWRMGKKGTSNLTTP